MIPVVPPYVSGRETSLYEYMPEGQVQASNPATYFYAPGLSNTSGYTGETLATLSATAGSGTTTLTFTRAPLVIAGMTVYGHANLQGGTVVVSRTNTTVTISLTTTGSIASGTTLGFGWVTGSYTSQSAAITGKTLLLLICGQSNASNYAQVPYDPNNAAISMLNPYDGVVYKAHDPLLGAAGQYLPTSYGAWNFASSGSPTVTGQIGSIWCRVAEKFLALETSFTRVILVNVAIGSASSRDWSTDGRFLHRLKAAWRQCQDLGWVVNTSVYPAIVYAEGVEDSIMHTCGKNAGPGAGVVTTTLHPQASAAADYISNFVSTKNTMAGYGFTGPWFIPQETYFPVSYSTSTSVRANTTAYTIGQTITVAGSVCGFYACIAAGTSAGSQPGSYASAAPGATFADGSATFVGSNHTSGGVKSSAHGCGVIDSTIANAILALTDGTTVPNVTQTYGNINYMSNYDTYVSADYRWERDSNDNPTGDHLTASGADTVATNVAAQLSAYF